jgi:CxxC-x17-CxxC domain-containing protein
MAAKEENEKIIYIGEVNWRSQRTKFGIKNDDRRRHIYMVGKTGMGKSNLLENMAIQDIIAGRGVAFIDPHGEAAEKLLDYVPTHRVNDVIYFNPGDVSFPTAFNVMEITNPEHRNLIASGLMAVFKKIWPDVWSARMEYILNNTILALLEYPNSTLLGINRMFSDPDFRAKVVEKITDPVIKSFWVNEYSRYNERYEQESTAAIQNKIGQFIANPLMRNIIGQVKSSIDIRKIMDEKKILIVNISKGMVGEDNSRLFGAMLITKLQLAAMSRQDIPEEKRTDFYCYVDEFQNFATDSFVNILSEARKYRLSLILANQYLGQLEEMSASGKITRVKDAVFGNVGTIIVFRVGAEDAEFLEPEFSPDILIEDFVNLGKYHAYIKLMIDGISSAPFSATTLAPIDKPSVSERQKIVAVSRQRYSVARNVIEDKISKWTGEISEAVASRPAPQLYAQSRVGAQQPAINQKTYDIVCSMCGKQNKVIFEPEPGRKIYCRACLKKMQESDTIKPPVNNSSQAAPASLPGHKTPGLESKQDDARISLENLVNTRAVRFGGQKDDAPRPVRPKKEIQLDDLKKALAEALKKNPPASQP